MFRELFGALHRAVFGRIGQLDGEPFIHHQPLMLPLREEFGAGLGPDTARDQDPERADLIGHVIGLIE